MTVHDLLAQANEAAKQGRIHEAIMLAEKAAELNRDSLDAHGHLAWFCALAFRYQSAAAHYRECLRIDPGNADACRIGSELRGVVLDDAAALEFLEQNPRFHAPRIQELTNRLERRKRIPQNHFIGFTLYFCASLLRRLRFHALALRIAELTGATQDRFPALLLLIARLRLERPQASMDDKRKQAAPILDAILSSGIAECETTVAAANMLAEIHLCFHQPDMAAELARTHALHSQDYSLYADAYLQIQRHEKALEMYHKQIEQDPENALNHILLGSVFEALNDPANAQACFEQAKRLFPSHPLALFYLGQTGQCGYVELALPHQSALSRSIEQLKRLKNAIIGTAPQFVSSHYATMDCAVCGSARHDHFGYCASNGWRIARCAECGLLFTNPQPKPEILFAKYDGGYWEDERNPGVEAFHRAAKENAAVSPLDEKLFAWMDQPFFAGWERALPERAMLDVGCGVGIFLREMQNRGWQVAGTEVSTYAVEFCRQQGFETHQGVLGEMAIDARFDLITLHHVIEHVIDPLRLIQECAALLKPGGRIIVRTPCADSIPAQLAGSKWFYDPDHVFFFNQATLRRLLERAGFRVESAMSYVGVEHETWQETWRGLRINALIQNKIEEQNQGDVMCICGKIQPFL